MRSFEHGYLAEQSISQELLMAVRTIGEFRGRQVLYERQSPEAKREMVRNTVQRLPARFRLADLQRACPGVSYPTRKRALADLRREKRIRCLGRGRDAEWTRIGSWTR